MNVTTFYAKSKPDILTVKEHTDDVVAAVEVLRQTYGEHLHFLSEKDWLLLQLAAKYHDIGKYSVGFQSRIRAAIEGLKRKDNIDNYPHNYLSVGMIPFEDLEDQYEFDLKDSELLALIVGYHHERERQPSTKEIMTIFQDQLEKNLKEIEKQQEVKIIKRPDTTLLNVLENRQGIWKGNQTLNSDQKRYILLKGLLHRADYAASAKEKNEKVDSYVEHAVERSIGNETKTFLNDKLRPLQQFTDKNQEKNILLVAQTGSGKTEAALIWIGSHKGFFTLPLRVSLNAIYDRVIDKKNGIGFTDAHLLHSGAFDYLVDDNEKNSYELTTKQILHAQLLAGKLTFSTIDQIFKFPLLYRGFERELATLAYSKVVIDEIQAYDPHIVAILIRGIEMIHQLGGKWMIMTATMPEIFQKELEDRGLLDPKVTAKETILLPDDRTNEPIMARRHRLKLLNNSILDCRDQILQSSSNKKVLVVVNTVQRALEMYDALKKEQSSNVFLLHSQFVARDRKHLEKEIKDFGQLTDDKAGVWVTTQIVEASIDVDFDFLFTEAATPDALFQRFGRCNRKGERPKQDGLGLTPNDPNVFVCTEDVSGMDSIYELSIVKNGLELLDKYDGHLLDEETKIEIVKTVFSEEQLEGSDYLKVFKESLKELYNISPFNLNSNEAQSILRDIQSCLIIPGQKLGNEARALMEQYYSTSNEEQAVRKRIIRELNQLTVSVNKYRLEYRAKKEGLSISNLDNSAFMQYKLVNAKYSQTRGLDLACDDVSSRFF